MRRDRLDWTGGVLRKGEMVGKVGKGAKQL